MKPKSPPELIPEADVPSVFDKLNKHVHKKGEAEASQDVLDSPLYNAFLEADVALDALLKVHPQFDTAVRELAKI